MKRASTISLLIVLSLSLTACGDELGLGAGGILDRGDDSDADVTKDDASEGAREPSNTSSSGWATGEKEDTVALVAEEDARDGGDSRDGGDAGDEGDTSSAGDTSNQEGTSSEGSIDFASRRALEHERSAYDRNSYNFRVTETPGRLACVAVEDTRVIPAGAGWQIYGVFASPRALGDEPGICPVGEYLMRQDYDCARVFDDPNPANDALLLNCMVRRTWNEQWFVTSIEVSQAGLVTVRETEEGCRFDTEAVFEGEEHILGTHIIPEVEAHISCGEAR